MQGASYARLGRVEKTIGSNGEVVVGLAAGLPGLLDAGTVVWFVPPSLEGPNAAYVRRAEGGSGGGGGIRVSFEGIDDLDVASGLVGRYVLVKRPACEGADGSDIIGREVVCADHGSLGHVSEIMPGPANDILVADGPYGEVLIPVVEGVVLDIPDEGPIRVRLLRGLIDAEAVYDSDALGV